MAGSSMAARGKAYRIRVYLIPVREASTIVVYVSHEIFTILRDTFIGWRYIGGGMAISKAERKRLEERAKWQGYCDRIQAILSLPDWAEHTDELAELADLAGYSAEDRYWDN